MLSLGTSALIQFCCTQVIVSMYQSLILQLVPFTQLNMQNSSIAGTVVVPYHARDHLIEVLKTEAIVIFFALEVDRIDNWSHLGKATYVLSSWHLYQIEIKDISNYFAVCKCLFVLIYLAFVSEHDHHLFCCSLCGFKILSSRSARKMRSQLEVQRCKIWS